MLKRTAILRKSDPRSRLEVPVRKPKTCPECKAKFTPTRQIQPVCSEMACNVSHAEKLVAKKQASRAKDERAADKVRREKLKRRAAWLKDAETAVNDYVRQRDRDAPCVSCGCVDAQRWNASHYRSVGSSPALRFDIANIHRSCAQCNLHLHGNLIPYRVELVRRIGQAEVDRLEGPQPALKLTVEDLKAIKADFRARARQLEKQG